MKEELFNEAQSRGRIVKDFPNVFRQKVHIPPDFSIPDDKEAFIDFQKSVYGWNIKNIKSTDIKRPLFEGKSLSEKIYFAREEK